MRCYLVALCKGSAVDRDTNNISLFELIEEVQITAFNPAFPLFLQAHVYLKALPEEIGREVDVRGVWVAEDGSRHPSPGERFLLPHARIRIRSATLFPPPILGAYDFVVEWRWPDDAEWHRENAAWPIVLSEPQTPALPVH
jgi:hypothetical protein